MIKSSKSDEIASDITKAIEGDNTIEIVPGVIAESSIKYDYDMWYRPISDRTQSILDKFDNARSVLIEDSSGKTTPIQIVEGVGRREVKVSDLGKLQAATGQEYSLLRGPNGERVLIQGTPNQTGIPSRYIDEAYKWSGHSHPSEIIPSSTDREILKLFDQEKSVINNAKTGEIKAFGQYEDLSNWLPGR